MFSTSHINVRRFAILATLLSGLNFGCGHTDGVRSTRDAGPLFDFGVPATERISLVNSENWAFVSDENDPYHTANSNAPPCTRIAFRPEYGGVELDTGICNQITLSQPTSIAIAPGSPIYITGWHSTLVSEEMGMGQLRVMFKEQEVWRIQSPIPGPAQSFDVKIINPVELTPGDLVYVHVNNHGANTWNILRIETERETEP